MNREIGLDRDILFYFSFNNSEMRERFPINGCILRRWSDLHPYLSLPLFHLTLSRSCEQMKEVDTSEKIGFFKILQINLWKYTDLRFYRVMFNIKHNKDILQLNNTKLFYDTRWMIHLFCSHCHFSFPQFLPVTVFNKPFLTYFKALLKNNQKASA